MSCSVRLPVYVLLTSLLFADRPALAALAFVGCYLLGATAALGSALIARRTIVRGRSRPMVLELPSYKLPSLRSALIVAWGRTYDCTGGETTQYAGVYVFRGDRSRFAAGPYDWTSVPIDLGAPLSLDFNVIESASYNPVAADLDGDGEREILFSDFSGRVHTFWLDGTEHGSWPFRVWTPAVGHFRYASEPAVADLDGDGDAEVLFASWTEKGSNANGSLYVLDSTGALLHQVPLPAALGSSSWNGALAAPTLADLDGDPDLELVLQTAYSGVVAYDLPGTAAARIHWGTGRGSYLRAGVAGPVTLFADGFESGDSSAWSDTVP